MREGDPVAGVSRRSAVAAAVCMFAIGAVAAGTVFRTATATPAVPASPASSDPQVSYEAYTYNQSDPEVARRLAAGEDPRTIPGVTAVSSKDREAPAASSPENEARLAEEAYEAGVTYETNAKDLPGR